ncbi:hypothetical protein [Photobacterium sp. GB-72]|uniref:hypothetical protein n=1 Tax=Photobacterium sp. GB-72 TaxID=2022105 RepID=UPI000D1531CE|nr:hypothetical protein [Photobacterium sp. GB-72]PSV27645.1 hypothetical protein C9J40_20125 [Photobacterium sp. GB-72]
MLLNHAVCITSDSHKIYQVSKFSNDENFIKLMISNNDHDSDLYGRFFFINTDGSLVTQDDNFAIKHFDSLRLAFDYIVDNGDDCWAFMQPAIVEFCTKNGIDTTIVNDDSSISLPSEHD